METLSLSAFERLIQRILRTLNLQPRFGDAGRAWTICEECQQGLDGTKQNTAPPKPDRIHLLAQIRRATIDDQEKVLEWLLGKFALVTAKKS